MKGIRFFVCMILLSFGFAVVPSKADAFYPFGGFLRNRVIQNNLNQQALRDLALQNARQNNFARNQFLQQRNFVPRQFSNQGFSGSNANFQNNGIIVGRTQFRAGGRNFTVVIDDLRGTFVRVNGVLVRVR